MPTVRLTWTDQNSTEEGHEIYRSNASFTESSLPAIHDSIGADLEVYEDADVPQGTWFYAVAAISGTRRVLSDVIEVRVGLSPPTSLAPGDLEITSPIIISGL